MFYDNKHYWSVKTQNMYIAKYINKFELSKLFCLLFCVAMILSSIEMKESERNPSPNKLFISVKIQKEVKIVKVIQSFRKFTWHFV